MSSFNTIIMFEIIVKFGEPLAISARMSHFFNFLIFFLLSVAH
jgi:hypothetical protein